MDKKDYLDQIVDYIKKNISKGYSQDSLKWALINQGYSRSEITKAMDLFNKELAKEIPKMKESPVIKYEVVDDKDNIISSNINQKKSFLKKLFGRGGW